MNTKYNGYENYQTWCVAMWLDNEQPSLAFWHEQAKRCIAAAATSSNVAEGYCTEHQAAKYLLADRLRESFYDANPLTQPGVWSDLLTTALCEVSWNDLADAILYDVATLPAIASADVQPQPGGAARSLPLAIDLAATRFSLGFLGATPGALAAVSTAEMTAALARHVRGDWGAVDAHDWQANDQALVNQTRLLSAYETAAGTRFWIVTEADRSATTVLLPDEY